MNKIRFSVCTNEIDAGMFGVYIRCEQFGKSILIDTGVHVFSDEWDSEDGRIIYNPNAKRLNLLIRKTLYQLEEYELHDESQHPAEFEYNTLDLSDERVSLGNGQLRGYGI